MKITIKNKDKLLEIKCKLEAKLKKIKNDKEKCLESNLKDINEAKEKLEVQKKKHYTETEKYNSKLELMRENNKISHNKTNHKSWFSKLFCNKTKIDKGSDYWIDRAVIDILSEQVSSDEFFIAFLYTEGTRIENENSIEKQKIEILLDAIYIAIETEARIELSENDIRLIKY